MGPMSGFGNINLNQMNLGSASNFGIGIRPGSISHAQAAAIATKLRMAQQTRAALYGPQSGIVVNMRRRLSNEPVVASANRPPSAEPPKPHLNGPAAQALKKSTAAIAAEVANKLAASTHSQQIMTFVLSTFAAEEAKNVGLVRSANLTNSFNETMDNRIKVEKPMPISDPTATTTFVPIQPMVVLASHQPQIVLVHQTSIQNQASTTQPQYKLYQGPAQQYLQSSGGLPLIGLPFSYNVVPLPPPPLPQMNLARPPPLLQQQAVALVQQPPPPPPPPPVPAIQLVPIYQQPAN